MTFLHSVISLIRPRASRLITLTLETKSPHINDQNQWGSSSLSGPDAPCSPHLVRADDRTLLSVCLLRLGLSQRPLICRCSGVPPQPTGQLKHLSSSLFSSPPADNQSCLFECGYNPTNFIVPVTHKHVHEEQNESKSHETRPQHKTQWSQIIFMSERIILMKQIYLEHTQLFCRWNIPRSLLTSGLHQFRSDILSKNGVFST